MDLSKIKQNLAVYAEGRGGLEGASDVHIGNVDGVEAGKYVKFSQHYQHENRQTYWFPIEWVRAVDEQAVFLNKTIDEVESELIDQAPSESKNAESRNTRV